MMAYLVISNHLIMIPCVATGTYNDKTTRVDSVDLNLCFKFSAVMIMYVMQINYMTVP